MNLILADEKSGFINLNPLFYTLNELYILINALTDKILK
jgi:hypothetical protein